MMIDRTTEAISHFIGHFHMVLDELRMRAEYDEFKSEKAAADDFRALELESVRIKSQHALKDYNPGVSYKPAANPPLDNVSGPTAQPTLPSQPATPALELDPPPDDGWTSPMFAQMIILPFVPIPSSVATVSIQTLSLLDLDVVGYSTREFTTPDVFYHALISAASLAESLSGPGGGPLAAFDAIRSEQFAILTDEVRAFVEPVIEGAETAIVRDGDVIGVYVNGVKVEEAPYINDLIPAAIAAKRELKAGDEEAESEVSTLAAKYEYNSPNPYEIVSGHNVVTGMNEVSNSVTVTTSMIDAGVIVVGGAVKILKSVSQTNVASDRDSGIPSLDDASTKAYNIAEFAYLSDNLDDDGDVDSEPGEAAKSVDLSLPSAWNLVYYEGDVVTLNAFTQITFTMDTDWVEFSFTASATMLGTGENILFNTAAAIEIGFGYDLIIVGGDMIDITMISQTNVLLDDDLTVVSGDTDVAVSGHDNVLVNHLSYEKHGLDAYKDMQDNFRTALKDLANGSEELAESVAKDELFAGISGLKALYISGDLIKVTAISQTNVLGDQDQVALALEDVVHDNDDQIEILTGSNLARNSAAIKDLGFDSVVMAHDGVYDDALLFQANLIDTDAAPLGVGLSALASEAVAFLADDMLLPELPDDTFVPGGTVIASDSSDVMQTMIA